MIDLERERAKRKGSAMNDVTKVEPRRVSREWRVYDLWLEESGGLYALRASVGWTGMVTGKAAHVLAEFSDGTRDLRTSPIPYARAVARLNAVERSFLLVDDPDPVERELAGHESVEAFNRAVDVD
ncbi:hypothetical protein [Rhodovibrio sodomensis]|uniref:hypothetical protein n=1 Tax=Rhodovibrio sodomensis TaxID=1088 RepID=UPI001908D10D|nr:hypothetical protein [Rhodovibrio sodomensis]